MFNLAGIDVVISTISGTSQLALIDAAAEAGVRRFTPAEFEGLPSLRPPQDALDRGRRRALERLHQNQRHGMQYCIFVCGILYERFAPGGMIASNIGRGSGISGEGDYVLNVRQMNAQIPCDADDQPATVCITAAKDVGRFVAAAVGMPQWPAELRICGERIDLSALVRVAEVMRGKAVVRTEITITALTGFQGSLSSGSITISRAWILPFIQHKHHRICRGSFGLLRLSQAQKADMTLPMRTIMDWLTLHQPNFRNGYEWHGRDNFHLFRYVR